MKQQILVILTSLCLCGCFSYNRQTDTPPAIDHIVDSDVTRNVGNIQNPIAPIRGFRSNTSPTSNGHIVVLLLGSVSCCAY